MSIVSQLPQMYLRGSLASETMTHLEKEDQDTATSLMEYVADHPQIQKHKKKYIRELNNTIGADYKDPEAAEQEFYVIIWRGVVLLFFHKKYEFICRKCNSSTYKNKSGTVSEIRSRKQKDSSPCPNACPNCDQTEENGDSPIDVKILGDAHSNPQSVIDDETQMSRWFSQQLKMATSQQLRENAIITTSRTNTVTDYADTQISRALVSMLKSAKISHQLVETTQGSEITHTVYFDVLGVSSQTIGQISILRKDALEFDVNLIVTGTGIEIKRGRDCKSVTRNVTDKINVTMLVDSQKKPDAPSPVEVGDGIDQQDDIETSDWLDAVYDRLPTENSKAVYQMSKEQGPWWQKYIDRFGEPKRVWRNVEIMLGLSKKELATIREQIKAIMIDLKIVAV